VQALGSPGTLVGVVDSPQFENGATELRAGDALVLYTDGLTEAGAPGAVWSPADLDEVLAGARGRPAQGIVEHLEAAAVAAAAEQLRDDVAVLALRAR
jgi:serine phosphatase RsbU (regulator of sigma subunit)